MDSYKYSISGFIVEVIYKLNYMMVNVIIFDIVINLVIV